MRLFAREPFSFPKLSNISPSCSFQVCAYVIAVHFPCTKIKDLAGKSGAPQHILAEHIAEYITAEQDEQAYM